MDTETVIDYEPKGKYYKFEMADGGRVVLTPVKVPAHVIAARKERVRKKQIQRMVEKNRQRAMVMNVGFVFFMTLALAVCCLVCYFYISFQGEVATRLRNVAQLQNQVGTVSTENDTLEKRIGAKEDIAAIKEAAGSELGMSAVTPERIIYYSIADSDYMIQYGEIE